MKSQLKQLALIYTAVVIAGFTAISYADHIINSLIVKPTKPLASSTLQVERKPSASARLVTSYQTQGGNRQIVQVTATNRITPQAATANAQGNQEDGDTFQPALGYGALGWTLQ